MQSIDIGYKAPTSSASINKKFTEIIGANGVLKGFNVVPGTGLSVNLTLGSDDASVLSINGARIKETADITGIAINPNNSGATRTDTLYAYYEHGVSGSCVYLVAEGTTQPPTPELSCKIAEIDVPDGASALTVDNIRMEPKIYSLVRLSQKADATKDGLMSKEDYSKLQGIEDNANNYIHPSTSGNKHIPAGGTTGKILGWASDGTAQWIDPPETYVHPTTPGNKHIPAGGTTGKILGWAADGEAQWIDPPETYVHPTTSGYKHIPSGGSAGQILGWAADGTAQWVNQYVHPTTSGNKHIPSGGASGQILGWAADGTAQWVNQYVHPTSAGYKHIPSGGASGQVLMYGGASGTATWANIPNQNLAMTQTTTAATLKQGALLKKTASTGTTYTIIDDSAKVWRAVFNDLAELWKRGEDNLEPGDVLIQGEDGVVRTSVAKDSKVIGVYSDTFGYCLGGDEDTQSIDENIKERGYVPIGISGKVLVKVKGIVKTGDLLVTSEVPGYARAVNKEEYVPGTIFGKALEDYNEEVDGNKRIWALIMNC